MGVFGGMLGTENLECPQSASIVYGTVRDQEAEVVTGDADIKDLPGVVYMREAGG